MLRNLSVYLPPYTKFSLQWTADLNAKAKVTRPQPLTLLHALSRSLDNQSFSCFFFFPQPHPWHMEDPGPGVKSELQLHAYAMATATPGPSCICDLCHHNAGALIH